MLCDADPLRALRGAETAAAAKQASHNVLIPLLSAACNNDSERFQEGLAKLILGLPPEALSGHVAAAAARWIWQRSEKVAANTGMPDNLLAIWDRVADGVFSLATVPVDLPAEATLDEALNSAGGLVALALLAWLNKENWKPSQGFPSATLIRLDRLASLPGRAAMHARVLLVRSLAFFHDVDPTWTERALAPRLFWTDPEASSLWLARAGRTIGRPALFNALKPAFLEALRRAGDGRDRAQGLALNLIEVSRWKLNPLAAAYQLEWTEVRTTLYQSSTAVRNAASWALWRWAARDDESTDAAARWRSEVGPLFGFIWPLDAAARDPRSSQNLAFMALECENAFPEAVEAIMDFLVPVDIIAVSGWLKVEEKHRNIPFAHPSAFLRLLDKIVGPRPKHVPVDLRSVLDECLAGEPRVESESAFVRLDGLARRGRG